MKQVIKNLGIISFLVFFSFSINAQPATLYFMDAIPNSQELNPALQPRCNVFINLPVPTVYVSASNTTFSVQDIIGTENSIFNTTDKEIKDHFYNKIKKGGVGVHTDLSVDILKFGWRHKKAYWTVGIGLKGNVNVTAPKSFFEIGLYNLDLNSNQKTYDLSDLAINTSFYTETAIGYSRKIGEKWTVGGKIKILNGIAYTKTDFSGMHINMERRYAEDAYYDIWLEGKANIKTAIPMLGLDNPEAILNDEGNITFSEIGDHAMNRLSNFGDPDYLSYKAAFSPLYKNWGGAIDLGFVYEPIRNLKISVGVTDLGFIRWNGAVGNYSLYMDKDARANSNVDKDKASFYEFYEDLFANDSDFSEVINLHYEGSKPFTTMLHTKINAAIEYGILNNKISFGLLSTNIIAGKRFISELTPSINFRPIEFFSATVSYSFLQGNYHSIGAGLNFHIYPFNLFIVSDYVPLRYKNYIPDTKGTNILVGFNMTFGCKQKNNNPSFSY